MKKCYFFLMVLMGSYVSSSQITAIKTNFGDPQGASLGNRVVFVNTTTGEMGSTDGTPGGTVMIPVSTVVFSGLTASRLNNTIIFAGTNAANGLELWSSDGTVAGTTLIKDIYPGVTGSNPEGGDDGYTVIGNTLYFTANDGTNGRELWKTDGTTIGTSMVKDINAIAINFPVITGSSLTNTLFFTVNTAANGLELWKSDGSSAGTVMVKDITVGASSSVFASMLAGNGTHVFFIADNGTHGAELWRTDGTEAGTIMLTDINAGLAGSFDIPGLGGWNWNFHFKNNILYFQPNGPGLTGAKIYKSDGTVSGTSLVTDLSPGGSGYVDLWESIDWGNYFYFQANGELYRSDGTAGGSTLVKDIYPGPTGSNPRLLRPRENLGQEFIPGLFSGGRFFLIADDGSSGDELWVSDGSTAGTARVKDIYPGLSGSFAGSDTYYYTKYKFFFSADNGTNGYELWQTDGTTAGTSMVMDIYPGLVSSGIDFFGVANSSNRVLFRANNGDGADIYALDATVVPFPVTLTAFSGALKGNDAWLKWTIVQENGLSHFNIQRSVNGAHFSYVASVKGLSDPGTRNYDYLDDLPGNAGTYYYRLEMVLQDGSKTYSHIVPVKVTGFSGFTATRTGTEFILHIQDMDGQVSIKMSDMNGNRCYMNEWSTTPNGLVRIPVGHLASGIYVISVQHKGQVYNQRLLR